VAAVAYREGMEGRLPHDVIIILGRRTEDQVLLFTFLDLGVAAVKST